MEVALELISSKVNGRRSASLGEASIHSFIFIQILSIDLE